MILSDDISSRESEAPHALAGLRVIDLTRVLAGPFCTALLADAGAEVIKIENPSGGDDARAFSPRAGGESGYFMLLNRGKKSLTLDLKSDSGRKIFHALVKDADVVVENFRPGTTKRLGIDYDTLAEINPRLIYASISGFGQSGPLSHRPSYDIIAQAMSGLMSVTGFPDAPPTRVGESIGDIVAGLYASWGILAALHARAHTGRGQSLDVAMLDSVFSMMVTGLSQYFYGGKTPQRVGNRHPVSTPFDAFRASDGLVVIAIANDRLFGTFAGIIGMAHLADDERFSTDDRRTANEPELRSLIESWTEGRTVAEVVETLEASGVPSSPIWTLGEAVDSEHVRARGLITRLQHPAAGEISLLGQPVRFSGTPAAIRRPPPMLGEHTADLLAGLLGLSDAAIEELYSAKVV